MTIVLLILKCIGILLAAIILLFLFLCFLVLFAPVRYSVCVIYENGYKFSYLLSWCFRLLTVKKRINSDLVKLYFLGIPIRRFNDKSSLAEKPIREKFERGSKKKKKECKDQTKSSTHTSSTTKPIKNEESKKGKKRKAKKQKRKNQRFPFRKISSIIKFARNKENKKVFFLLWKELNWLIRYIKPKKMKGKLCFGTGNPSSTGLFLGGISLFPVAYTKDFVIIPNFDEKVFRLDMEICGMAQVYFLAKLAWRLYRNKQVRMTIKRWNNL